LIPNNLFETVNTGRKVIVAEVKCIPIGTIIDSSGLEFTKDHDCYVGKKISVFLARSKLVPATDNYYEYVHKGPSLFFHKEWLSFVSGIVPPPKEASGSKMKIEDPTIMATDLKPCAERDLDVIQTNINSGITLDDIVIHYSSDVQIVREIIQQHLEDTTELLIKVNNLLSYSNILIEKIKACKNNGKDNKKNIT
jgi:hypothetical protein